MTNPLYTLVHKHAYEMGGIGDFIRASISLFYFCKKMNIDYYIDFSENPLLIPCFDYKKYHTTVPPSSTLRRIDAFTTPENMQQYLQNLSPQETHFIYCNEVGFAKMYQIQEVIDEYTSTILKPSPIILKKIQEIRQDLHIEHDSFISVHVRCGDYSMNKPYTTDFRIHHQDFSKMIEINQFIETFKKYNPQHSHLPFLFHSDSLTLKENMKNHFPHLLYPSILIKHIAENAGTNTQEAYISTIAEFYLLSQASFILIPLSYSGFSHWSAILGKKPIVTNVQNEHFTCLN